MIIALGGGHACLALHSEVLDRAQAACLHLAVSNLLSYVLDGKRSLHAQLLYMALPPKPVASSV